MLVENIKKLCQERGISVHALEKALGFSNSSIAKWGSSSPTIARVIAVAEYFGVTVDDLLN